jgi:ribosome-associated translation inhibitor RaiA
MAVNETGVVQVRIAGVVQAGMAELAKSKVEAIIRHVGEPVLSARVVLSKAADPAVQRPAIAWAVVSVNGRIVRASGVGSTMREAIAQLVARLRIRLERAWPDEREQGRRTVPNRRLRRLD